MGISFDEIFGTTPAEVVAPSPPPPTENAPAAPQEPWGVSEVTTPSGIEIYYQAGPKRLYRLGQAILAGGRIVDWFEVPSVSEIKEIIDRSGPLTWWAQGVGVKGVLELLKRKVLISGGGPLLYDAMGGEVGADDIIRFLTEQKLTVNHDMGKAADRGTSVHGALESWAKDGVMPQPDAYPEQERGYVQALVNFLEDSRIAAVRTEVMVGSIEREYAGRFDLDAWSVGEEVCVHVTEKGRGDRREVIPPGLGRWDLKTSKGVYDEHFIQLGGYELAAVECGYDKSDFQAVINVKDDGRYQVKIAPQPASTEAFIACRILYSALQALKGAK